MRSGVRPVLTPASAPSSSRYPSLIFLAAVDECAPDAGNYGKQVHITVRPGLDRRT